MGAILMAMTIGGVITAAFLLAISFWTKKAWLRNFVFGGVTIWFVSYTILLFTASFWSEEKTLNLNEPKEFCGFYLDCHMHASVTGVRRTKIIADRAANGEFYVVKVKVFSDAKRAEIGLLNPQFYVVDADGNRYRRVEADENPVPAFDRKVPAGGSFEKEVVFDLPADVKNPRLDVAEGIGIDKAIEFVLIGDEDSVGHKRKYFMLDAQKETAKF